jgi:hypothetical protein
MSSVSVTCYATESRDQAQRPFDLISQFSVYSNGIRLRTTFHEMYVVTPHFLNALLSSRLPLRLPMFFIHSFPVKFLSAYLIFHLLVSTSVHLLSQTLHVYVNLAKLFLEFFLNTCSRGNFF